MSQKQCETFTIMNEKDKKMFNNANHLCKKSIEAILKAPCFSAHGWKFSKFVKSESGRTGVVMASVNDVYKTKGVAHIRAFDDIKSASTEVGLIRRLQVSPITRDYIAPLLEFCTVVSGKLTFLVLIFQDRPSLSLYSYEQLLHASDATIHSKWIFELPDLFHRIQAMDVFHGSLTVHTIKAYDAVTWTDGKLQKTGNRNWFIDDCSGIKSIPKGADSTLLFTVDCILFVRSYCVTFLNDVPPTEQENIYYTILFGRNKTQLQLAEERKSTRTSGGILPMNVTLAYLQKIMNPQSFVQGFYAIGSPHFADTLKFHDGVVYMVLNALDKNKMEDKEQLYQSKKEWDHLVSQYIKK